MQTKYREFAEELRIFVNEHIGRGKYNWFSDHVGLDDRNLRRWTGAKNLPSEDSWKMFCEAVRKTYPVSEVGPALEHLSSSLRDLRKAYMSAVIDRYRDDTFSSDDSIKMEDYVYPRLFQTLQVLAANPHPRSLSSPWTVGFQRKVRYLESLLERSAGDIRVICYSFIIWKDRREQAFLKFVRNGGCLKVLMVHPQSRGFLEKAAMEACEKSQLEGDTDLKAWQSALPPLRRMHRKDIEASIATLEHWRERTTPANVQCRFYYDAPLLSGAAVGNGLFLTSHFFSPTGRAFDTPTLCIDDYRKSSAFKMLHLLFNNWFEIKFSTGTDPLTT